MKTIEEINKIAPYHPLEWQQGYGIWQAGFMKGQKSGAEDQNAIDHSEEHLNWIIKKHEEWSSMFNPNNISFKEWIDKALKEEI